MCLIGLLLPFKRKEKSREYRYKSSGHSHRRSERSHRERAHVGGSYREKSRRDSSHRESSHRERPHRERSHRREKAEPKEYAPLAEDALARLCLSLEQSLLEEQQRWREQDRLDWLERQRLGLEQEHAPPLPLPLPSESAPPSYSFRDERAARQQQPSSPEEPRYQTGVADSPACRRRSRSSNNRDSVASSTYCCKSCVCARCGAVGGMKCPTVPELDDTRVRNFADGGAGPRRRRA